MLPIIYYEYILKIFQVERVSINNSNKLNTYIKLYFYIRSNKKPTSFIISTLLMVLKYIDENNYQIVFNHNIKISKTKTICKSIYKI